MKDPNQTEGDELRAEFDFTGAVRGRYAARYAEGTNIVVLDPDLARLFPDSASVNTALRSLVDPAKKTAQE